MPIRTGCIDDDDFHITPLELAKFSLSIFTAIFKALAKALKALRLYDDRFAFNF